MVRKRRTKHLTRHLVMGYLERVARGVFSDFSKELTDLVGTEHGVYALYKGNHLYYVGLATNLRTRIKNHLKDKHANKWDKFSLYLVRKADHIRELESLIMRIADPKGNATTGKLKRAINLRSRLRTSIRRAQKKNLYDIFEGDRNPLRRLRQRGLTRLLRKDNKLTSSVHIQRAFTIRAMYRGQRYKARIRKNGSVFFRGKLYSSPSAATVPIVGRSANGWTFWHFRDRKGVWVPLTILRKD